MAAHRSERVAYVRHAHIRKRVPAVAAASRGGLPSELAAKVDEIASACPGFKAISTCRPGAKIAGTNHTSLHASCRAADIAGGSWSCAYSHLASWPGGVSTDAERMQHIHISYAPGGQEWGARFRHGGGSVRYAHRHHVRYGG